MFGVLWILLGLVVIAMFTATATSALSISSSDLARLEGNEVKQTKIVETLHHSALMCVFHLVPCAFAFFVGHGLFFPPGEKEPGGGGV